MVGANLHKDVLKRSRSCEPNGLYPSRFQRDARVIAQRRVGAGKERDNYILNLGGTAERICFVLRVSKSYS